ncbi:MAG: leucyl aminopeptidase family protein [Hyphomicrobiaceae bacterium]
MHKTSLTAIREAVAAVYASAAEADAMPIHLVGAAGFDGGPSPLDAAARAWVEAQGLKDGAAKKLVVLPGTDGRCSGVALGIGNGKAGEPCGTSALLVGLVAQSAPEGVYRLSHDVADRQLAELAWGLGAYKFRAYKTAPATSKPCRLALADGDDARRTRSIVEAVWFGRDLINTPASDLGPAELETAARDIAAAHGASVTSVVGDDLLAHNFPMIHAVGRASSRAPRLVDMRWAKPGGSETAPRVTLVGKGICFDTGGLDIQPSSTMLLMKKDMGGAATALSLAHMVMSLGLDVRLRVLIPAAENAIGGDAFRPSDILKSRAGLTVEVGNTDAEGRLVLADALSLADEEAPDMLLCFATLTGAARVALGPDLPALFTDDGKLAHAISRAGSRVGDPVWRMPLWPGYMRNLDSEIADMGNVSDGPFAGAITAALFLKKFVNKARRFAHVDLYGWRPAARPLGPKGGEPQTARAWLDVIEQELAANGASI